jgi:modified peptide precursor CbpA
VKQANDTKPLTKLAPRQPDVIAIRKTCDASGTGLSHYVLMDKQAKR